MATQREKEKKRARFDARAWASKQTESQFEPTSVRLPEGVHIEWYKLEVGTHEVDFMLFNAGKGNPRADKGFATVERSYSRHTIRMPNGRFNNYVCLGDICPLCKHANDVMAAQGKEAAKGLWASQRHLWLLNAKPGKKPGTKDNPWKVFDTGHRNRGVGFGELMMDAINLREDHANFAEPDCGYKVILTVKEQQFDKTKYNGVTRIDFEKRNYQYPEEVIDKAPCLDDMLIFMKPDDLKKVIQGGATEEDDQPYNGDSYTTPVSRGASSDEEETEEEEEDEDDTEDMTTAEEKGITKGCQVIYKGKTWTVTKVSGDGSSLTLQDEEEDEKRGVAPGAVELVKKTKPGKKPVARDPDPEDDGEDLDLDDSDLEEEDDEEPVAQKSGKKTLPDDDDDLDDSDLEEEEEEPAPKKPGKAPAAGKKKAPPPEDDDDDLDLDDSDLEEEEEEVKPAPKKPGRKK